VRGPSLTGNEGFVTHQPWLDDRAGTETLRDRDLTSAGSLHEHLALTAGFVQVEPHGADRDLPSTTYLPLGCFVDPTLDATTEFRLARYRTSRSLLDGWSPKGRPISASEAAGHPTLVFDNA
jgi:hypothetical protein